MMMSRSNQCKSADAKKATKAPNKKPDGKQKPISKNDDIKDLTCDICAQNVPGPEREEIFAFGKCDHYVCYVCSTRLRVICDQSECPICREKLDNVIFSNRKQCYERINLKNCIYNEKYKIYFESKALKDFFDKLLTYECQECLKASKNSHVYPDVSGLKNHLNSAHKLKLCDLCLNHNKLFPFEYSYYDSLALRKHMKDGEPKTSHRGHPSCALCRNTFFNNDELIQHMSREHFHCHLCGRSDSNLRIYFLNYESLKDHFKAKHFLCERDNCMHEQFTSAFDSELEYRVHLLEVHGHSTSGLGRNEARLRRTIILESNSHRGRETSPNRSIRQGIPRNAAVVSTGTVAVANSSRQLRPNQDNVQIRQQRLPSRAEFPALGQQTSTTMFPSLSAPTEFGSSYVNHYPSLAQTGSRSTPVSTPSAQRSTAGPSNFRGSFVRTAGGSCRAPETLNESEFPPLPQQQPKMKKRDHNASKAAKATKNIRQKPIKIQLS